MSAESGASVLGVRFFCWCWGQFCNINCDLSVHMGDRSLWIQNIGWKHWGISTRLVRSRGGVQICLYHQFSFPSFPGFSWWWWSRGRICDLSMNMENWSQWGQHLGRNRWGIRNRCVGVRGGVDCNFITNFIFLLFLIFRGGGRVGGKFAIYQ